MEPSPRPRRFLFIAVFLLLSSGEKSFKVALVHFYQLRHLLERLSLCHLLFYLLADPVSLHLTRGLAVQPVLVLDRPEPALAKQTPGRGKVSGDLLRELEPEGCQESLRNQV